MKNTLQGKIDLEVENGKLMSITLHTGSVLKSDWNGTFEGFVSNLIGI